MESDPLHEVIIHVYFCKNDLRENRPMLLDHRVEVIRQDALHPKELPT